jgi:hypothetical protein
MKNKKMVLTSFLSFINTTLSEYKDYDYLNVKLIICALLGLAPNDTIGKDLVATNLSPEKLKELQAKLKFILESLIKRVKHPRSTIIPNTELIEVNLPIRAIIVRNEDGTLDLSITSDDFYSFLIYLFLNSLREIPSNNIKKCPTCKIWFLQTTLREKLYCSNMCASKAGNKRRRNKLGKEL